MCPKCYCPHTLFTGISLVYTLPLSCRIVSGSAAGSGLFYHLQGTSVGSCGVADMQVALHTCWVRA